MSPCTRLLMSLFALLALPALAEPRIERTTMFLLGNKAGHQVATYHADGRVDVHFEYNDRGRGPKLDASFLLDDDGTPRQTTVKGLAYFKTPVDESFVRDDAGTRWRNASEDERREGQVPGFYIGLEGVPEEWALMARALLAAPDQKLAVLPVGEARIRRVTTLPIGRGRNKVDAVMVAIEGLAMSSDYLWLDAQGRFFASWSSWQTLIREGYEEHLPALGKVQQATQREEAMARARKLTQRIDGTLVVDNVRVFDPAALAVAEDQRLVIADGRIRAVGPAADTPIPEGSTRMDGAGRFAMPGMFDMHVHVNGGNDGLLHLAGGVTSVRDLANDRDALAATIKAYEDGTDLGPRVIRAGFVDGRSPYSGPTKVFADNEDDVRAAMAQFKRDGFEHVKVYSSLKPELVPLFAELTRANGMRLSGHVPDGMAPSAFVRAGADEIQHANFLMMEFLDRSRFDTRTPARFTEVAKQGAGIRLHDPAVQAFIDLLVAEGTVIDPTLVAFEDMFLDRPGRMGPTRAATVHRLPPTMQRFTRAGNGGLETDAAGEVVHRESYRRMVELVGLMHRSGVTIVAGTDTFVPFSLARELELYTQAGIPPAETLRIATLQAARVARRDHEFGRIQPGFVADVILVDGDPTRRITDLRRVHTVIRGDRWFDTRALHDAVGIGPE